MSFQITALDHRGFARYFAMSADELAANHAVRVTATSKPGFPCRVSLADAEVGDDLVLVNFEHQPGASPYRAAHAIFVREGVAQARPAVGETPEVLRARTLSLRAFDEFSDDRRRRSRGRPESRGRARPSARQSRDGLCSHPLREVWMLRGARRSRLMERLRQGRAPWLLAALPFGLAGAAQRKIE